jgi:CRP-like cAMP-binding protein
MTSTQLPTPSPSVKIRSLQKGETLFCQGDEAFGVFVVRRGRMRLVRHLADGSAVVLYTANAGSAFSEAALFSLAYHCDAVADTDSEIEIHPKAALLQALDGDAAASRALMAHMAGQIIALRSRLEIRNIRSAEERVLHLLQLKLGPSQCEVILDQPLKDVATEAGLTHEAFYRALAKLEASGRIVRDKRRITLLGSKLNPLEAPCHAPP